MIVQRMVRSRRVMRWRNPDCATKDAIWAIDTATKRRGQ
jgi:hypothetical protein